MNSERNILIACVLNLGFSVFELVGGMLTGSVAILSDAVHDLGDAVGIGLSWLLERQSRRPPDRRYTYGYARFSVLGSVTTCTILLTGSVGVMVGAVERLMHPHPVHPVGMMLLAVVGVGVNLAAAFVTRRGDSLNQKAVNLHMLEDVLTWVVVLLGAALMEMTQWTVIDPLVSLGVAVYILIHAVGHLRAAAEVFLEKLPAGCSVAEMRRRLEQVAGVVEVSRLQVRSIDGIRHAAEVAVTVAGDLASAKAAMRQVLAEWGVVQVTIETE